MKLNHLLCFLIAIGLYCLDSGYIHAGDRSTLLVIDVQQNYTAPDSGSRVCPDHTQGMISVVNYLSSRFAERKTDIIYILQNGGGPLSKELNVTGDLKFTKNWPSSFSNLT